MPPEAHTHDSSRHRCRLTLSLILPIILATCLVGTALTYATVSLTRDPIAGIGFRSEVMRRIADAIQWKESHPNPQDGRLAVILGASGMREAISVAAFNRQHQPDWNIVGLVWSGRQVPDFVQYLDHIDEAGLIPDHLVIGLNLCSHPNPLYTSSLSRSNQVAAAPATMADTSGPAPLAPTSLATLLSHTRHQMSLRFDTALTQLRYAVHGTHIAASNSRSPDEFIETDRNPFREVQHFGYLTMPKDLFQMPKLPSRRERESMPPVEFDPDSPFAKRLRQWLNRGIPVTVIFVPESRLLRTFAPLGLAESTAAWLNEFVSHHPGLRIVDLQDRLEDHLFGDSRHLSAAGRDASVPLLMPWVVPDVQQMQHNGTAPR